MQEGQTCQPLNSNILRDNQSPLSSSSGEHWVTLQPDSSCRFRLWTEEERASGPPCSPDSKSSWSKPRTLILLFPERILELCWIICLRTSFYAPLTSFLVWVSLWEFLQERKTRLRTQNPNKVQTDIGLKTAKGKKKLVD